MFVDNIEAYSLLAHKFIFPYEIVNRNNIVLMKSDETYLPANNRNHCKI